AGGDRDGRRNADRVVELVLRGSASGQQEVDADQGESGAEEERAGAVVADDRTKLYERTLTLGRRQDEITDRRGDLVRPVLLQEVPCPLDQHRSPSAGDELDEAL